MITLSYRHVTLKSGFLYEKQMLNESVTMKVVYDRFYDTGRVSAFRCDWKEGEPKRPHIFWDSDVAKWMEAAAYILQKRSDADLEEKVEAIIDEIEKNQWEDGYFNSYFITCEPENRFSDRERHELYCAGHLMEAAVAYYEATGKDRFLKLMEKYALCIEKAFVTEKTAKFSSPGHQEIELALIRMYRATGNKRYLNLAKHFLDVRGYDTEMIGLRFPAQTQIHLPIREQTEAVGHCVRACYMYAAMADIAFETKDTELLEVCKTLFSDITEKKMYLTGGIGSTRLLETFTIAYDLLNDKAYAETCAAISLMFFAQRMMQSENLSVYADIIERILYNGMISGLSLDGKSFFYENPLEINLNNYKRFPSPDHKERFAIPTRAEVFSCSCCPPNLNRVLASLGNYLYGYETDTVFVNQFADSEAEMNGMKIIQKTDYPRSGRIVLKTENIGKLCVRIPSWCANYTLNVPYYMENGYAVIENPGREVVVDLEIRPFLVESNPEIYANNGKVAVCCGPYVCAGESVDNIENLHSLLIDGNFEASWTYDEALCGYSVSVKAFRKKEQKDLYSRYTETTEDFLLRMIPYAAFANRGESNMCVWFRVMPYSR
ncbi:MAG: glycoside hydrolase family 127 protein [Clostridia bacterium]|nr:glycoside hydrolase family 127 protein [Clostridia bacterium]